MSTEVAVIESELRELEQLESQVVSAFYTAGFALRQIRDTELHIKCGFKDWKTYHRER